MLPTPEIRVWSSSARLTSVRRRRSAATNAASSNCGSSGSRAMCAISAGSSRRPARPPARRTCAGRRSAAAGRRRRSANRIRRCVSRPRRPAARSIWPDMPRWPTTASPLSSGSHRYLPRRRTSVTVPAGQHARRSPPPRPAWRRTARGCSTSTVGDACGRRPSGPGRAGRSRPRAAQARLDPSSAATGRLAAASRGESVVDPGSAPRNAASAARCSASFLVRPCPRRVGRRPRRPRR